MLKLYVGCDIEFKQTHAMQQERFLSSSQTFAQWKNLLVTARDSDYSTPKKIKKHSTLSHQKKTRKTYKKRGIEVQKHAGHTKIFG